MSRQMKQYARARPLHVVVYVVGLVVILALGVLVLNRQQAVSRQGHTIQAQQTAIARQHTTLARQQAQLTAITESVMTRGQPTATPEAPGGPVYPDVGS